MATGGLDVVGVQAVFEGFADYLNKVAAFNKATDSTTAAVKRAAASTKGIGSAGGDFFSGLGKSAVAAAIGVGALSTSAQVLKGTFGFTLGASIAFEDSFAGIRKTVDATEAEFKQLAAANRELAKTVPLSVDAINALGEAGGALGVTGVANILKFEKVVADLANTTNLTAEAAATAIAQLSNIFQTSIQDSDRFGSALVDLGNKGASTEAQIVEFSLRIGAAGKLAGLTIDQVAGIGSAFASVGVEAEAGGTSIQKVLIALTKAVATGGKELKVFADTAGLSIEAFRELAQGDPAKAFTLFVEGLGKAGDKAFGILEALGEQDSRTIRSFLSVANAGDLLARSLDTASTAYKQNTALAVEAEKRYATTASQIKILQNNVRDAGISFGDQLLPAINQTAGALVTGLDVAGQFSGVLVLAEKAAIAFAIALAAMKITSFLGSITLTEASVGRLGAAMQSTAAQAGLLAAVFLAIDAIAQAAFGEGIISFLTGAKEKAEEAARAQRDLNQSLKEFDATRLSQSTGAAADEVVADILRMQRAVDNLARPSSALSDFFKKINLGVQIEGPDTPGGIDEQRRAVERRLKTQTDTIKEALANFSGSDLSQVVVSLKLAGLQNFDAEIRAAVAVADQVLLKGETLEEQTFRAGLAAGESTDGWNKLAAAAKKAGEEQIAAADAAKAAADGLDALNKSIDDIIKGLDSGFDPVTAQLELQIATLEREKIAVDGAGQSTKDLDHKLDVLNATLDAHNADLKSAEASLRVYAASLIAGGKTAAEAAAEVEGLKKQIFSLPEEERIKVLLALPDLEMNRLLRFLAEIARGVTIDVALRIAQAPAQTTVAPTRRQRGSGTGLSSQEERVFNNEQVQQWLRDIAFEEQKLGRNTDKLTDQFAGAGSSASDAAGGVSDFKDQLTLVMEAITDGVISLSEAVQLGLTDEQIVILELEAARQKEAEAAFRSRIEFQVMAAALNNANISAEAFILSLDKIGDAQREALDATSAAIDRLFGRNTRQDSDLKLKLDEAKLARARSARGGASEATLKTLDAAVKKIQDLIEVRSLEKQVAQDRIELADQTLISDQDQILQGHLLAKAKFEESQKVKDLNQQLFFATLAHINVANAANDAAAALRNVSGGDIFASLSPSEQHSLAVLLESLAGQGALASGGIASRVPVRSMPGAPTVISSPTVLVGEDNRPEMVLPLTKPDRMREILTQSGILPMANGGFLGGPVTALPGYVDPAAAMIAAYRAYHGGLAPGEEGPPAPSAPVLTAEAAQAYAAFDAARRAPTERAFALSILSQWRPFSAYDAFTLQQLGSTPEARLAAVNFIESQVARGVPLSEVAQSGFLGTPHMSDIEAAASLANEPFRIAGEALQPAVRAVLGPVPFVGVPISNFLAAGLPYAAGGPLTGAATLLQIAAAADAYRSGKTDFATALAQLAPIVGGFAAGPILRKLVAQTGRVVGRRAVAAADEYRMMTPAERRRFGEVGQLKLPDDTASFDAPVEPQILYHGTRSISGPIRKDMFLATDAEVAYRHGEYGGGPYAGPPQVLGFKVDPGAVRAAGDLSGYTLPESFGYFQVENPAGLHLVSIDGIPLSLGQKAYINAIARQKGEIEPFEYGTDYVRKVTAAILHPGERVMTAEENKAYTGSAAQQMVERNAPAMAASYAQLRSGAAVASELFVDAPRSRQLLATLPQSVAGGDITNINTFSPSLTTQDNEASVRRQFEGWLEEFFRQSRSRASRAGATISGSIG